MPASRLHSVGRHVAGAHRKLRLAKGEEMPGLTVLILESDGSEVFRIGEGLSADQAVALYLDRRSDSELLLLAALGELL